MTVIGYDIETTGLKPKSSQVCLAQLSSGEKTFVVDALKANPAPLLQDLTDALLAAHNAKFEWQHTAHTIGVELDNLVDTLLMELVLDAGDRHESYSLEAAVSRHLPHVNLDKKHQSGPWDERPLS